jgi:hypothetical protein
VVGTSAGDVCVSTGAGALYVGVGAYVALVVCMAVGVGFVVFVVVGVGFVVFEAVGLGVLGAVDGVLVATTAVGIVGAGVFGLPVADPMMTRTSSPTDTPETDRIFPRRVDGLFHANWYSLYSR